MISAIWIIVLTTFVVSVLLMSVTRRVLAHFGVIDVPNHRSSHNAPVVRGAGMALSAALILATALIVFIDHGVARHFLVSVSLTMTIFASFVGAVEDIKGISARLRLLFQLFIGASGTIAIVLMTNNSLWWVPLGALVTAGYINTANFMDGINGISGFHGLVVGGIYSLIGVLVGAPWLILGGLLVSALFTSFLPWNLLRGHMFLGDVGSYLLGCSIASLAIAAVLSGIHPVALAGPVVIYVVDVASTLVRRISAGEKWTQAHRSHIYQRLTNVSTGHVPVAGVVALLSLVTGLAGLLALDSSFWGTASSIAVIVASATLYMALPRIAAFAVMRVARSSKIGGKVE